MDQNNENKKDELEIDIGKIIYKMRDKFILIAVFTIMATIVMGLITQFAMEPKYSATVKMYVYSNTDRITSDSSISSQELDASQELINTYIYILQSDTVLEAVIEDLDINMTPNQLKGTISASKAEKTVAFEVTVTTPDRKLSAQIANSIAKIAPKEIVRVVKAGGVEIIDYAKVPTKPSSPNLVKNLIIAAVGSFVLSFLFFFIYEFFDTTITSERDIIGEFEFPVLGTVPNLEVEMPSVNKEAKASGTKTVNKKTESSFTLKPSDEILENIQNAKGDEK